MWLKINGIGGVCNKIICSNFNIVVIFEMDHYVYYQSRLVTAMKLQSVRLAMPLLGVLLWVLSIHAGIFSDASRQFLLEAPLKGFIQDSGLDSTLKPNRAVMEILTDIKPKDLNETVQFAESVIGYMERLESNLMWSNIKVTDGTPSHGMLISFGPDPEAMDRGRDAVVALRASTQLFNIYCPRISKASLKELSFRECAELLSRFSFKDTSLKETCIKLDQPCDEKDINSPYRSANGSCNSDQNGHRGESFTGYSRLIYANYADGAHETRHSVTNKPLPNSRAVVSKLVKHGDKPSAKYTLALMQWSQFIEHDLCRSATASAIHTESPIECCSKEGDSLLPRYVHPFCSPIYVSDDELYAKQGVHCLNFVRSVPAIRSDCSFGSSDQVNQATHYLDGSQIYGSTLHKSIQLRSFYGGKLKMSNYDGRKFLPLSQDPTRDCQIFSKESVCFESGDARVNFQPPLALMHTLFYREHNRIAEELAAYNPHWNDEILYQEARRIVGAVMQKITYSDWLEVLLGSTVIQQIARQSAYKKNADATVSNAFATAAMRSMKSLSDGVLKLYDEDRVANETILMRNYFNNPAVVRQPDVLAGLARGLATQPSQMLDIYFADDLINQLYTNGKFGFDVLSFDVQRGRDHGLPSYTEYRQLCGLRDVKNFVDFIDVMREEDIMALKSVYQKPQDVDLIIGGLLEKPKADGIMGPTFSCIIAEQMLRTRQGDRYFWDNMSQPKPFTSGQIKTIYSHSLARIICDNADSVKKIQRNVFKRIGKGNPLVDCDSVPTLDLSQWQEKSNEVTN